MQLSRRAALLVALLSLCGALPLARAEHLSQNPAGEVQFRGQYWRDRNTRVINPAVDMERGAPNGVRVGASYLLDAITSASVAAGAASDQPFTELRHEASLRVEVPLGFRDGRPSKHSLIASYGYSSESDYWSHNAGLRLKLRLASENTTLMLGGDYGHNTVGRRMGPDRYLTPPLDLSPNCRLDLDTLSFADREGCYGRLHTFHFVGYLSQILSPTLLLTLCYEITLGLGYWNNPYRPVLVLGEIMRVENLPTQRVRHAVGLTLRKLIPLEGVLIPFVALRPALRFHADDWGLKALSPELAVHLPIGPLELRAQYSFYGQLAADFYRSEGGGRADFFTDTPIYGTGAVMRNGEPVFTSDVKMGPFTSHTVELALTWRLSFLGDRHLFGDAPLSRTMVSLSGGAWFADRAVGWQFGIPLRRDDPSGPAGCSQTCGAFFGSLGLTLPL